MVRGIKTKLTPVSFNLHIKTVVTRAFGMGPAEPTPETERIPSGSSVEIIQSTFQQAFRLLAPRRIVLLVEEINSGRLFRWQAEPHADGYFVNSEEFDSTQDEYLQLIPSGDWVLQVREGPGRLDSYDSNGRK